MRVIHISVDLTEAPRSLFHVQVELPVRPNSVAIFTTPVWIQESHRDNGPIGGIAGLHFSSGTETLKWRRNPKVVSEYLVHVPVGADTVHASFDAIVTKNVTRRIAVLNWEHVLMYPAHRRIENTSIRASVTVPKTWKVATALENLGYVSIETDQVDETKTLHYHPSSVERLQDSPILAGLHFSETKVSPDGNHMVCIAADSQEYAVPPLLVFAKLARLTSQTQKAFGNPHYERYRWLIALTDHLPNYGGLEHHECSLNTLPLKVFVDGLDSRIVGRGESLLAHEFVHSWNGKYRRPKGHAPHDFATPLDGRLLWVYEGLSMYYQDVLSVRSAIISPEEYRAQLARTVAWLEGQSGRLWRSTEDTGTGASLLPSSAWGNWMRGGQDYYREGVLVWLDVDTMIRSQTENARSLDDFTEVFFGKNTTDRPQVILYTLHDIISCLQEILPFDWQAFFQTRVVGVAPRVNVDGIERAGYRLQYVEEAGPEDKSERATKEAIWNSVGIALGDGGRLEDVRRGGPGDVAKLAPGQSIVKIADSPFSVQRLADEIKAKKGKDAGAMELSMAHQDDEWTAELRYHGGLRYPRLVPVGAAHYMSAILATRL